MGERIDRMERKCMRSSYKSEDVIILLKDITGLIKPLSTEEREKKIQSGTHYSEMLPVEYEPTEQYLETYQMALEKFAKETSEAVCRVAEKIYKEKGKEVVLVSLARAGLPIGILIKHYLEQKYGITNLKHYAISIIRGKGIDRNAMQYILDRHSREQLQFVDGWIGKGAISKELSYVLEDYPGVSNEIAVLADPAGITSLYGTRDDILIPSSCLNSTVSGLISRTFYRGDIIKDDEFHGAVYYGELKKKDLSYDFIEKIEKYFDFNLKMEDSKMKLKKGIDEVLEISKKYGVRDINLIKPGVGETTRVLLRRVPWKILVDEKYKDASFLKHLYRLASEKKVQIEYYPLEVYKVCGIIKSYSDI